jgi:phage tail-like protein
MAITDPIASYNFFLEIQGETYAQFKEVSGVGITIGVIEHRANTALAKPVVQKFPGAVKYEDIHLSRGKVSDPAFWKWIKQIQDGQFDSAKRDGSIILYDFPHAELTRFHFFGAWPYKVEIGKLQAGADSVLIESMILAVERVEVGGG